MREIKLPEVIAGIPIFYPGLSESEILMLDDIRKLIITVNRILVWAQNLEELKEQPHET